MKRRLIATILVGFGGIALMLTLWIVAAISRHSAVPLPQGYQLKIVHQVQVYPPQLLRSPILLDPKETPLLQDGAVARFMVHGQHVYGWLDREEGGFFHLHTATGDLAVFHQPQEMQRRTTRFGLPRLEAEHSFTFWDLSSGSRSRHW